MQSTGTSVTARNQNEQNKRLAEGGKEKKGLGGAKMIEFTLAQARVQGNTELVLILVQTQYLIPCIF